MVDRFGPEAVTTLVGVQQVGAEHVGREREAASVDGDPRFDLARTVSSAHNLGCEIETA
jgi:hypothetical protein